MHRQQRVMQPSLLTRAVDSVFRFVRLAEFEILFVLFFVIAFLLFKDLVSVAYCFLFPLPVSFSNRGFHLLCEARLYAVCNSPGL
jgi:hypothetical protein